MNTKLSSPEKLKGLLTKQNVTTTSVAVAGTALTAWRLSTLTTTTFQAVQTSKGMSLLAITAKASVTSKIIVGAVMLGTTALACKATYNHFNKKSK